MEPELAQRHDENLQVFMVELVKSLKNQQLQPFELPYFTNVAAEIVAKSFLDTIANNPEKMEQARELLVDQLRHIAIEVENYDPIAPAPNGETIQ